MCHLCCVTLHKKEKITCSVVGVLRGESRLMTLKSSLHPRTQHLCFCTGNSGVVDIHCKTVHLLASSSIPMQTSVNLFLLVSKHNFLEQNAFLVICQRCRGMSQSCLKVFSPANVNWELFYVQRVIFAAPVSFKSSCLTLGLTKQLCENSLPHNAWLNLPAWNPSSLLVHWLVSQIRARVPVSTWAHRWLLFRGTRSVRQPNKFKINEAHAAILRSRHRCRSAEQGECEFWGKLWPETRVAACFDLVWQRRRAAEDRQGRQWSKSTPTYLCSQYFMEQHRITKTCHHKISDCFLIDICWIGVIQSSCVLLNLSDHIYTKWVVVFFSSLIAQRNWRAGDEKPCLPSLQRDAVKSVISGLLYSRVNTPPQCFIYRCCFTWETKQQWQMHRTKCCMPESERIRHDDTSPLQHFVMRCQCITQTQHL